MSPYENKPISMWPQITEELVQNNPISKYLVNLCFKTWASILNGKINSFLNLRIEEMNISPQAISHLFHDIFPVYIERSINNWKKGTEIYEKDVVNTENDSCSFEIKVSSSKNSIFGNRSYGQLNVDSKKSKDGYYLAINIDKLAVKNPTIRIIRFGWLDHSDWFSQQSPTGQQARIRKDIMSLKFKTLYSLE